MAAMGARAFLGATPSEERGRGGAERIVAMAVSAERSKEVDSAYRFPLSVTKRVAVYTILSLWQPATGSGGEKSFLSGRGGDELIGCSG